MTAARRRDRDAGAATRGALDTVAARRRASRAARARDCFTAVALNRGRDHDEQMLCRLALIHLLEESAEVRNLHQHRDIVLYSRDALDLPAVDEHGAAARHV